MKSYAFVSRHEPTPEQHALATAAGIKLVTVGDRDAFTIDPLEFIHDGEFTGVVVVHPAAALRCIGFLRVAIFENRIRAADGGKPSFFAVRLHHFRGLTSLTDEHNIDFDSDSQAFPVIVCTTGSDS